MPKNSVQYRAKQLAWLSGKIHELGTCDDYQKALEGAETEGGDSLQQANLREMRHHFDRSTKLPQSLVEESSETTSLAKAAWADARTKSDFVLLRSHMTPC